MTHSPTIVFAVALLLFNLALSTAQADNLVADISENQIAITSSFTGKKLILFGAIDRTAEGLTGQEPSEGIRDVVVVIRGPEEDTTIRKKDRRVGIWVNANSMVFKSIPSYYFVASNRPFEDIASDTVFARNEIGAANLRYITDDETKSREEQEAYQAALIRNKKAEDLYYEEAGAVQFIDQTLFRTTVEIPANVPTGVYTSHVFLIRDGKVVSVQSQPLYINKTGLERGIYQFAHQSPFTYGVLAVIFAFFAGWVASLIFRQD